MSKIFIFPNLGDEPQQLVTNQHGTKLLAAYQVLVNSGLFSTVVVNELPIELARKLYPKIFSHLTVEPHHQTGGIEIKPKPDNE